MNNTSKCLVAGALALTTPLMAQAESPHTFSANVALTSDYLFRGISQTSNEAALQGGFDYSYDAGSVSPYAGIWASSIDFGGGASDPASIEVDYYAGLAGAFSNGISWDVGGLYYHYPSQNEDAGGGDYDYWEAYGSLGYTFAAQYDPTVSVFYAYSPDFYGEDDTGHYVSGDLGLSLPHGFGLSFLVGYQEVDGDQTSGPEGFDYMHYSVGVSKSIGMFTADLSWNDSPDEEECGESLCDGIVLFSVSSSW